MNLAALFFIRFSIADRWAIGGPAQGTVFLSQGDALSCLSVEQERLWCATALFRETDNLNGLAVKALFDGDDDAQLYLATGLRFIAIYMFSLPFGLYHEMGWMMIPTVCIIFYAFVGIEIIGEEIEDPFGTDANDLPIQGICETIRANVKEILITTEY
mgnify:CR=1 FL=1